MHHQTNATNPPFLSSTEQTAYMHHSPHLPQQRNHHTRHVHQNNHARPCKHMLTPCLLQNLTRLDRRQPTIHRKNLRNQRRSALPRYPHTRKHTSQRPHTQQQQPIETMKTFPAQQTFVKQEKNSQTSSRFQHIHKKLAHTYLQLSVLPALIRILFHLTDKFLQFIERNLFLPHQRRDDTQIGIVKIFTYYPFKRLSLEILP